MALHCRRCGLAPAQDFLERRLQTLVFKLGLAKSIHHARVLIRQRHIRCAAGTGGGACVVEGSGLWGRLQCCKTTSLMAPGYVLGAKIHAGCVCAHLSGSGGPACDPLHTIVWRQMLDERSFIALPTLSGIVCAWEYSLWPCACGKSWSRYMHGCQEWVVTCRHCWGGLDYKKHLGCTFVRCSVLGSSADWASRALAYCCWRA